MVTTIDHPQRSEDLKTLGATARYFSGVASARIILTAAVLATMGRVGLAGMVGAGGFGLADLTVGLAVVLLVGPVEWFIHLVLLHAPADSRRNRWFTTSASHRQHHNDPSALDDVLLAPTYAGAFVPMIALFTVAWAVPVALALRLVGVGESWGAPGLVGAYLTALVASLWALAHYEWVHLLIHTMYRPQSRYYKRLARNHRFHHHRNENYWLGVTSNIGDRMFATLPADKGDVPLSDTARSLA